MRIKRSIGDKVFDWCNTILLLGLTFITLYPLVFVLSSSLSGLDSIVKKEIWLFPKDINFDSYLMVLRDKGLGTAYINSIVYTVAGTLVNVLLTTAAAYPLSRKGYSIRGPLMLFIAVTMYFSGGLVPQFVLINNLGLYNTRWVIVLLGAVNVTQLVIARVFFQTTIPDALSEAARIDGANDVVVFFKIVLPLSKSIIAVLTLQYAVAHWNDFFQPLIYLSDTKLQPLALYMRRLLISGTLAAGQDQSAVAFFDEFKQLAVSQQFKYATIVITILPILCIYPFLQRYFVNGVMIGAVKE